MATLYTHMYNPEYFELLCPVLKECSPEFDSRYFIFRVFDNAWPEMELHQRTRHIARVLHDFLPADFPSAAKQLVTISAVLKRRLPEKHRPQNIFIAHYIEVYGAEYPEESLSALGGITALVTPEFAIRPFVTRYPGLSARYISEWMMSGDPNLRRLSSLCHDYLRNNTADQKTASAEFILS